MQLEKERLLKLRSEKNKIIKILKGRAQAMVGRSH